MSEDLDYVGTARSLTGCEGFEAMFFRQVIIGGALKFGDDNIQATIPQVLCLGVALAAVANDCHFFPFQHAQIGIRIIIDFHCVLLLLQ